MRLSSNRYLPVLVALWAVGALCVAPAQAGFEKIELDSNVNGPKSLQVLDLDGVNGLDILAVHAFDDRVVWYENQGNEAFTMNTVGTMSNPSAIVAGDLNNDGALDLVVTSFSAGTENWYVSYYLNDGSENFTQHTVDTTLAGAEDVVLAHLDNDAYLDFAVVGYESDTVAWFENNGASTPNFTRHDIATEQVHCESIDAADLDGDGNVDLVTSAFYAGEIVWWESSGGATPTFIGHVASSTVNGPKDVSFVNVDGDGDLDIVAVSFLDDEAVWLENDGSETFTTTVAGATPGGPVAVHGADRNADGFIDLVVACFDGEQVVTLANDGTEIFTMATVDDALGGAESPVVVDLDQNGETDIVAAGFYDDNIIWYVNKGIFYDGYIIDDSNGGNGDGNPDPGETIALVVDIRNEGDSPLTGVYGVLDSDQPGYVTWLDDTATYPDIPVGGSASSNSPHFRCTLSQATPCGQAVNFTFDMFSDQDNGGAIFGMAVGGISDDMESGEGNWTHYADTGTDDWEIVTLAEAHSPIHAWYGDDVTTYADKSLVTATVNVSGTGEFSFWHTYSYESYYDGGVIEISTDGGSTWADIGGLITSGNGYNDTLAPGNPLGARDAWSGGSIGTMEQVTVDLSGYLGQAVNIRFRIGCDVSVGGVGWYIDDVVLEDCQVYEGATIDCDYTVTPLSGTVPFQTVHRITLYNNLSGGAVLTRRIAARIAVTIGNGTTYNPWRAGFTNLAPASTYFTQFPVNFPGLPTVLGDNTFVLSTVDVTPAPYNQPPYPSSGDSCTKTNVVDANAP